jgi:hypothetical protein
MKLRNLFKPRQALAPLTESPTVETLYQSATAFVMAATQGASNDELLALELAAANGHVSVQVDITPVPAIRIQITPGTVARSYSPNL